MNKNLQIEGVRGIACILVALHHIVWSFSFNYLNEEWAINISDYAFLGRFGIFVFLIISAYYMVTPKPNADNTPFCNRLKMVNTKIVKLYKRLWIGYVLTITIIFLITKLFNSLDLSVSVKTLFLNYTMLAGLIPKIQYVDGAHWYIAMLIYSTIIVSVIEFLLKGEVLFYLLWLLASFALGNYLPSSLRDFSGIMVLIICEKRLVYLMKNEKTKNKRLICLTLFALICALAYTFYYQGWFYFCLMLLSNLIIALCILKRIQFFDNTALVWIGSLSLYIYLFHQEISYVIEYELTDITGEYSILYAILALCISIFGGWIIKYLNEHISKIIKN